MNQHPGFTPPAQAPPYGPAPTATHQRFPGGRLPPVGAVFNETLNAFTKELGPYALAGLGYMGVAMALAMGSLTIFYVVLGAAAMAGTLGAAAVGDEQVSAAIALMTMLVTTAFLFVFVGLISVLMAPLTGSTYRAVALHQRGEKELDISAAFSSWATHLMPTIVAVLVYSGGVFLGMMACYLPGLVLVLLLIWALPLATIHGVGGVAACSRSLSHVTRHLGWSLHYFGVFVLCSVVAGSIPVIGPMFLIAFQVRMYREVFGDGAQPVWTHTPA